MYILCIQFVKIISLLYTNIIGKLVAVQQDFEDNFVESEENNLTNMKCTCQLCPIHVEMQNKNGVYFKLSCTCLYKIIYNNYLYNFIFQKYILKK